LEEARKRLLAVREKRVRPQRDDKVLTGWNGLVISALARAAAALDEPAWLAAARRAVAFVRDRLMTPAGDLLHTVKGRGEAVPGFLEDYAYLAAALLDMYEATLEPEFLEEGQRLARRMLELFWDDAEGGLFMTPAGYGVPLERPKELWDQATPSGNGVAALTWLRLYGITGDDAWRAKAEELLAAFAGQMSRNPWGTGSLLLALDQYQRGAKEVGLVG